MANELKYEGGKINYEVVGSGFPVILIHGYLENLTMWKSIIPMLNNAYQFISIDLPGHGNSDVIKLKDINTMAEVVDAVVTKLQLIKAHLVGHSMGGYVALAYYDLYRGKCDKVCLFHSSASEDGSIRKVDRDRAIKAIKIDFDKYVYLITPNLFSKETFLYMKSEMIEFILMALTTKPKGAIEALKAMKDRPNREELVANNASSFYYLLGVFDQILPVDKMELELKSKPGIAFQYLSKAGHLGFLECPSEVAKFLNESFLN